MRRNSKTVVLILAALAVFTGLSGARAPRATAQDGQAGDAAAARIEGGGVIMESQVKDLGALQTLTQTVPDSRERRVQELIEQWIVLDAAKKANFPAPSGQLVDAEEAKVAALFPSSEAYAAKLREVGLSSEGVRQLLSRQILVDRYLDQKFRASIQIDEPAIKTYYQKEWLPALSRENESAVALSDVEDRIREVLTEQAIRERSAKWISNTQSQLKIERVGSASAAQ